MKKLTPIGLIVVVVILVFALVPDAWLVKATGIGGPKVTEVVLKVSGEIKKIKTQLIGLAKRQPKIPDPLPLAPKGGQASVQAMEPSGGGGIPGGETPSSWGDRLKKILPYALPVLVALVVIGGGIFIRSKLQTRPGGDMSEVQELLEAASAGETLFPESSYHPPVPTGPSFPVSPYIPEPVRPLDGLVKEWGLRLLFVWLFAVICLVASELPIVPLKWRQTAGFFMNFSLLGLTPFVILMFAGGTLSNVMAPLATGAQRIFGDAGRSVVVLINYAVPLGALVTSALLLAAQAGGNVTGLAASTGAPAVSKLAEVLSTVTAGNPLNVAIIALSLIGYIIIVMIKAL